jgi:hypothetical protein
VDATRTVAMAAGPYVQRGSLIDSTYDQSSLLRTIEVILGLDPLNINDGLAVPMFRIFTQVPDLRPYQALRPAALSPSDGDLYSAY